MIEWIKKYNVLMKAAAILAAIILWFIVIQADNPERSVDFTDIPVEFIGQQELLENSSLIMIGNNTQTVDLELSGSIAALTGVSVDDITIRADLSKYESAGVYNVAYDISAIDQIVVKSRNPSRITVTLDDVIEKELEILEPTIEGDLAEDIVVGEAIMESETVTISGAKSEIEHAAAAAISVSAVRLSDTYSGMLDYTIVDAYGEPITGATIKKIDKKVNLEIPVYKVKTVPLEIRLADGFGASVEDATVDIFPSEVEIIGGVKDIDKIEKITLGRISLNDFVLTKEGKFDIKLPDGIELTEDISEAEYSIYFDDIGTVQLSVENIEIQNPPADKDIKVQSISVVVTVRGHKETLKNLTAENVKLVVNLAGKSLVDGQQIAAANAVLDETITDAAALGRYSVIIEASDPEPIDVDPSDEHGAQRY